MIPRYDKPEISQIWSEESKYEYFLKVELALVEAQGGDAQSIQKKATINLPRIHELEAQFKHDMIAFCTSITENLTPQEANLFHFGATSSDISDTALSLQIKDSLEVILRAHEKLLQALKQKALAHRNVMCLGRSHGQMAEPMSLGQKFLGHFAEFRRRDRELRHWAQTNLRAQFSGAVGQYTIVGPDVEKRAADLLGLAVEPLSSQVIPRDRLAKLISIGGLWAGALERLCVELRLLHHGDVGEVEEGFAPKQRGSSIMPHKKNPISTENLTGVARMLRSHVTVALENVALWHERDISHSLPERLYLPDHLGLMLYATERLTDTLDNLKVHTKHMEKKVHESFEYWSSFYLHKALAQGHRRREELYGLAQRAAFECQDLESFHKRLQKELGVSLPLPDPRAVYLKHGEDIYERVLHEQSD